VYDTVHTSTQVQRRFQPAERNQTSPKVCRGKFFARLSIDPFPDVENLSANVRQHSCGLWTWVSIDFEATDAAGLEHLGHTNLHNGAGHVGQHGIGISVSFEDAAPAVIVAETPVVVERAQFILGLRNHGSSNRFELIQLSLMDRKIDRELYDLSAHV
jgi:hypothetical protein